MFWHVRQLVTETKKALRDIFDCMVMVYLSSLKDIHSHTKHTEEILTGINPQGSELKLLSPSMSG